MVKLKARVSCGQFVSLHIATNVKYSSSMCLYDRWVKYLSDSVFPLKQHTMHGLQVTSLIYIG